MSCDAIMRSHSSLSAPNASSSSVYSNANIIQKLQFLLFIHPIHPVELHLFCFRIPNTYRPDLRCQALSTDTQSLLSFYSLATIGVETGIPFLVKLNCFFKGPVGPTVVEADIIDE